MTALWRVLVAYVRRNCASIKVFVCTAGLVFVIGIVVVASIRPQFEAEAVIAPQKDINEAPSSSAVAGLSSISSLFQGGSSSENLVAFQQLMSTAELANALKKNQRFMHIAFPSKRVHRSLISRLVRSAFGRSTPTAIQPSDVQNFVTGNFYPQKLMAPDYLEVSFANPDRDAAIEALRIFLATSDNILRSRERASLVGQIRYLSDALKSGTDVTQLAIFRQMLEQKLSSEVLLDTQPTYAFRIFDAPDAPAVQTSPNLSIMLAIVVLASLIAGGLAVFAKSLLLEYLRTAE